MLFMGRPKARLAVTAASVSDTDHVVDIGCGPGTAARAAASRGARVTGIDPATVMLRVARAVTPKRAAITGRRAPPRTCHSPTGRRRWCGRWRQCTTGRTSARDSPRRTACWRREDDCSRSSVKCGPAPPGSPVTDGPSNRPTRSPPWAARPVSTMSESTNTGPAGARCGRSAASDRERTREENLRRRRGGRRTVDSGSGSCHGRGGSLVSEEVQDRGANPAQEFHPSGVPRLSCASRRPRRTQAMALEGRP
jgi:Methyltransferase domain